jgi:hypothetical protein
MNEKSHVRALVGWLRTQFPQSVVFKFADMLTTGIPDIAVTIPMLGTKWLECKYHRGPAFIPTAKDYPRIQLETVARLAHGAFARYVVFIGSGKKRRMLIMPAASVKVAIDNKYEIIPAHPQATINDDLRELKLYLSDAERTNDEFNNYNWRVAT